MVTLNSSPYSYLIQIWICRKIKCTPPSIALLGWAGCIIKHLATIFVCLFWGNPLTPLNTLTLCSTKCFNIFLCLWKINFVLFQEFLHNNMLILFNNVLCYCKAFNDNGNKLLLLDVNAKTRFLGIQKDLKIAKMSSKKKILSDLVTKILIDFILFINILWLISWAWCFQKKNHLWTPFLTKGSECDVGWCPH